MEGSRRNVVVVGAVLLDAPLRAPTPPSSTQRGTASSSSTPILSTSRMTASEQDHLEDAALIPYDEALLANLVRGGEGDSPCQRSSRSGQAILVDAVSIYAGPVETARKLRYAYSRKRTTIVQWDNMLLNLTNPKEFCKDVEKQVHIRSIGIIFDEVVDTFPPPGTAGVMPRSGKAYFSADVMICPHMDRSRDIYTIAWR
ncbi:hypothetical protein OBBRIDRAFT_883312 [Obba rivulosa]|uniref:Uncharacterized protein n=1 Tax=Obba rivulosa TaxID=1052685 RepID=A0A8E2J7D5_9APHY|nr:hypothetical protein OBBRIDRAFT_883312 [Obba rivulosa]